ncbi:hypothetical protein COO60DRAFT_558591 [Scenedesmus sp. NREL 46B-D3]|nr:hypothetical protein COO60DRAFT_558591 [Scenedesmus sp. NREL 46B-D3]
MRLVATNLLTLNHVISMVSAAVPLSSTSWVSGHASTLKKGACVCCAVPPQVDHEACVTVQYRYQLGTQPAVPLAHPLISQTRLMGSKTSRFISQQCIMVQLPVVTPMMPTHHTAAAAVQQSRSKPGSGAQPCANNNMLTTAYAFVLAATWMGQLLSADGRVVPCMSMSGTREPILPATALSQQMQAAASGRRHIMLLQTSPAQSMLSLLLAAVHIFT